MVVDVEERKKKVYVWRQAQIVLNRGGARDLRLGLPHGKVREGRCLCVLCTARKK